MSLKIYKRKELNFEILQNGKSRPHKIIDFHKSNKLI